MEETLKMDSPQPPSPIQIRGSRKELHSLVSLTPIDPHHKRVLFFLGEYRIPNKGASSLCPCYSSKETTAFRPFKYGFPGSDGSALSNYRCYLANNQELLSIFFAHPDHPIKRWQRCVIFSVQLSWALFLVAFIEGYNPTFRQQVIAAVVTIIVLQPFALLLLELAQMQVCERYNCCTNFAHWFGSSCIVAISIPFMLIFVILSAVRIGTGSESDKRAAFRYIFTNIALAYSQKIIFGLSNWIVLDWDRVPFIGSRKWLQFLLYVALGLCEETYTQSKLRFAENFGAGVVSIDEYVSRRLGPVIAPNKVAPEPSHVVPEALSPSSPSESSDLEGGNAPTANDNPIPVAPSVVDVGGNSTTLDDNYNLVDGQRNNHTHHDHHNHHHHHHYETAKELGQKAAALGLKTLDSLIAGYPTTTTTTTTTTAAAAAAAAAAVAAPATSSGQ